MNDKTHKHIKSATSMPPTQQKISDMVNKFLQRQLAIENIVRRKNPELAREMARTTSVVAETLLRMGGVYRFYSKKERRTS